MNPENKMLLEEIQKMFREHSTSVDKRLADQAISVEQRFLNNEAEIEQRFLDTDLNIERRVVDSEMRIDARIGAAEGAIGELQYWRQEKDGFTDDLRLEIGKLHRRQDQFARNQNMGGPGAMGTQERTAARTSAGNMAARPEGHHYENHHRESGFGVVTTLSHSPVTDLLNPTLREAERCYFFGDISSKRDPEAYLNCLFHLYDYFVGKYRCDENEMLPLIVNTPGWVKGAGFDMLVEMLRYICPTIVVQIRITMQSKNLPDGVFWLDGGQTGPQMINIDASFRDALNRSFLFVKDSCGMRERRLVEYLKHCFPSNISLSTNKELAYALASLPPYQVPFSDVTVVHLHCKVPAGEIWHSLNATIVGLAVSNSSEETRSIPYCVGLGIVRGIDVQKGLLYLITPVPLQRLQNVDLLQQGLIEIPTTLLQVRGCVSPYMSTNVLHKISERDLYAG